jgi:hypothetical protein
VCPKRFLSLLYVRRKPSTNLALRLALSPNISKDLPLDPHHLGVPSCVSKIIYEPMVRSAQTVLPCCVDTNIAFKLTKTGFHIAPRHLGVPSGASKMIFDPVVHTTQTVHLSCIKISTISKRTERASLEPCHLAVPSGASKTIPEPIVRSAQTVLLSCMNTNTLPKRSKMRFHMAHVTKEFHWVRPK